ncbi:hypothetical protein THAOC_30843 [Thalassiosira oceanica]|uniref:Uncharacterized protein n=1 Tax=Thalassiosira oceanica TaxID=159749 RepID=K0R9I1_THAOC|nr:hypothetical protein THAOC_30843 [Thalassiosira oceanica]|eukprot:EJK50213.1 hypothetical protein THAOC_30843 [Thalassiosira oceanica]
MKIEVPESAWKVALPRALGPGIMGRALERPGKARKACFHRKFGFCLRQKLPFNVTGKTRPAADLESCRAASRSSEWDEK